MSDHPTTTKTTHHKLQSSAMRSDTVDEDDEELQRAIALSLEGSHDSEMPTTLLDGTTNGIAGPTMSANFNAFLHGLSASAIEVPPSSTRPGLMAFDRKAMEQERLARAAARKKDKSISPPPRKRVKLEETAEETPPFSVQPSHMAKVKTEKPAMSTSKHTNYPSGLMFPTGVIRKTWSARHPTDNRTIKIENIIDKDNVHTAVLSTFNHDPDWILGTKFNLKKTKFYMILHAKSEADRAIMRKDFEGVQQTRLCLPKLTGRYSCQHSKLMLLFFSGFLRIAIPTANLVDFDWGESGIMENSVFIIDLPRSDSKKSTFNTLPPFGQSLLRFLKNQDVDQDVRDSLFNFDFSATQRLAFIHTSAGSHFDDNVHQTGIPGLGAAVRELGLQTDGDIQVDFATSSLGSLNDQTVNSIYEAAQGKDITTVASRERIKQPNAKVKSNMRIYFPSDTTVKESLGGEDNAGTICLDGNSWNSTNFPRTMLRDHQSTRKGLLSHNKIMLVRGKKKDGTPIAWAYVGSANMSESAWGKMVTKDVKLNCNNWESGVLVPVENPPEDMSDLGNTFKDVLDVPFLYGEGKGLDYTGKKPWLFKR